VKVEIFNETQAWRATGNFAAFQAEKQRYHLIFITLSGIATTKVKHLLQPPK